MCHHKHEQHQQTDHDAVAGTVAEVGTYDRRQFAALTPRYIHAAPCLAEERKDKIKGVGTENRHTFGRGRNAWNTGRTQLYAPADTAYDMRQHRYGHHQSNVSVVHTLLYDSLYLVDVNLMEKPQNQNHRNPEGYQHFQHLAGETEGFAFSYMILIIHDI